VAIRNASKMSSPKRTVHQHSGFTLPELLVAIFIGSLVIVMAAQSLISHIQLSARSEAMMRSQDIMSRIQNLVDQDIQEARCVSVENSGNKLVLSITTWCNEAQNGTQVIYQSINNVLTRTGPAIDPTSGGIDLSSSPITSTVSSNISEFSASLNSAGSRGVTYSINVLDPSGFSFKQSKSTGGHLRSRLIN